MSINKRLLRGVLSYFRTDSDSSLSFPCCLAVTNLYMCFFMCPAPPSLSSSASAHAPSLSPIHSFPPGPLTPLIVLRFSGKKDCVSFCIQLGLIHLLICLIHLPRFSFHFERCTFLHTKNASNPLGLLVDYKAGMIGIKIFGMECVCTLAGIRFLKAFVVYHLLLVVI